MKLSMFLFAVILLLSAVMAPAQGSQPPTPGPEHKRLGVFVGSWLSEGKTEATPFSPAGPLQGTMSCVWFRGSFHIVCDSEDVMSSMTLVSHSIFGYSREKKQYYAMGIDSTGYDGSWLSGKVDKGTWSFEGSTVMEGKTIWYRTVVKELTPQEMTWKGEFSEDGKTWKSSGEGKMRKK